MNERADEALVLDTRALGETDLVVTLLAAEHGKVRAVAPAARRSRRRFGGCLEPLTLVRARWREHPGRELARLEGLECLRSFARMQAEPRNQAAVAVLAQLAERFTHEGQGEPQTFRLLAAAAGAIEQGTDPWVLVRYVEYWMLRLHGLLPELARCALCEGELAGEAPAAVVEGGGVVCRSCESGALTPSRSLATADREFLRAAARLPPGAMLAAGARVGPGGGLELLLRGTLESYAERRIGAYRHLAAAVRAHA